MIVCCDGTWFASDKGAKNLPSNVARIGRLVANEGEAIVIENDKGVLKKVPQVGPWLDVMLGLDNNKHQNGTSPIFVAG